MALHRDELQWCDQEASCSPALLLLHLLDWGKRLRKHRQVQARRMLAEVLQKILARRSDGDIAGDIIELPEHHGRLCRTAPMKDGRGCAHCHKILGPLALTAEHCPLPSLAKLLRAAFDKYSVCGMVAEWLHQMVACVAACVHDALCADLGWADNPENLRVARGKKRRRRVDAEVKKHILKLLVAKRFRRATHASRAGAVDVARQSCADLQHQCMLSYWQGGGVNLLSQAPQIHIACEDSVVGGESTMLLAAWHPQKEVAAYGCTPAGLPGPFYSWRSRSLSEEEVSADLRYDGLTGGKSKIDQHRPKRDMF